MVMEGMEMGPNILLLYSTAGTKIMLTFSPYVSLLMPTMWNFIWWIEKTYLCVTVSFLMYMDKLVYSNSDSNKEEIKEQ